MVYVFLETVKIGKMIVASSVAKVSIYFKENVSLVKISSSVPADLIL